MEKFQFHTITACTNPLIKSIGALHQTKVREQENAFIFEGTKLFEEAVSWQVDLTHVFFTEHWLERASDIQLNLLRKFQKEKILVSDAVMHKISGQKQPEGILCRAGKFCRNQLLAPEYNAVVVLENVQDPGNVGTIIRTADAAGFSAVYTTMGTADIYNEKVLRASMGSVFHLPVYQHFISEDIIKKLQTAGWTVIGSALKGSEDLFRKPPTGIYPAVVLGNESSGMTEEIQSLCDYLVRIPMRGYAESLNVSVAAGLMLYQFVN